MSQRMRTRGVIVIFVAVIFVAFVMADLVLWMGVTALKDGLSHEDIISQARGVDTANVVMGTLLLIGGALGLVGVGWLTWNALQATRRHGN